MKMALKMMETLEEYTVCIDTPSTGMWICLGYFCLA